MKITKQIISALLATAMLTSFAGCTKTVVTSEIVKTGTEATTSIISGTTTTVENGSESENKDDKKENNKTSSSKSSKKDKTSSNKTSGSNKTSSANKGGTSVAAPSTTHDSNKGELKVENAGKDENADYSAKGTVTISVDTARATDYEALFDSLKAVYKDINIKFDYFSHAGGEDSAAEYLSTRAAAGKLPDIVWDDAGKMPLYIQQGWVYPLDDFVKGDPEFKYVPDNLKRDYTYGGKLYALPHQAHYEETLINLDVLEATNQDLPSLAWTTADFEQYLKKAANNKYSGIEMLHMMDEMLCNAFYPEAGRYGYNPTTQRFDVKGFVESVKYLVKLRAIPNLEAWALRRSSTGGKTDYEIKFNTTNSMGAFNKGLTLFHGVGTWELADAANRWSNMNWTMWTVPQHKNNMGSMPVHVDHCFMTSTCENPETAFQVLRYITYSTEGNIARLSMYDKENAGKYATINTLYYPTTTSPEVAAKFKSLPKATETDVYLFENIGKSMRFDFIKIVPGWTDIVANYITDPRNQACDGTAANVEPILKEMENKVNVAIEKQWKDFNTKLAKVQAEFKPKHK